MNNGDEVRVRQYGQNAGGWRKVKVDLVSRNQESLAVSAEEGLGSAEGFGLNAETGRQQLILMKASGQTYLDIFSGILWEEVEND